MKTILFADVILKSLNNMAEQFMSVIPRLITAVILYLIGLLVAKFVYTTLKKVFEKIQLDKIGDKLNEIEMVSNANMNIKLSEVFAKIIYYIMMLFFIVAATDVLGMPAISQLVQDIFNFVPNLIVALIVLILGLLLAEAIKSVVLTALKSLSIPSATVIANFLFYFLFVNIVVSALSQAKINTEFLSQNISLLIGGGVLAFGIGYGLASKDVIANFLASFYSKDRVSIGDIVTLDGNKGEVTEVDRSSITIDTGESKVIIPLSKMSSDSIEIHNK